MSGPRSRPRCARPIGHAAAARAGRATATVAIVIADITRPSPSERLVPWILAELAHVPRENFVILNGTGSHRANTRDELVQMLGARGRGHRARGQP